MSDDSSAPRRIIIDEDWKSQVQAEKEALNRQQKAGAREPSPAAAHRQDAAEGSPEGAAAPTRAPESHSEPERHSATESRTAPEAGAARGAQAAGAPRMAWPAASFSLLLNTLGTQALLALGQPPDEHSPPPPPDLDQAKYLIDTLQVLEEKSRGNLTEAESRLLGTLLHELRIGFVHVQQTLAGSGATPR